MELQITKSTFSLTKLQHLKFLRSAVNTTSFTVTLIINSAKFLELEELDLRGIPLLPENFSGILKTFKALRILKVTILELDLGELVAAVKTTRSSIVKPNHNNLQILCLCNNTDDITNKTLEILNSSGVKICTLVLLSGTGIFDVICWLKST